MAVPRFQISDLLARYSLEPSLRDVFVEGRFDQDVLSSCIRMRAKSDVVVYEIDCVDVSSELLRSFGLTNGNRQRVISLAKALADSLDSGPYRCIADKDLDHWLGTQISLRGLTWTEHCSIELYFLDEDLVKEILVHSAKSVFRNWSDFYASFISVLQDLYALRLATKQLNLSPEWISFDRCLGNSEGLITIDLRDYTNRLLMGVGKAARADEVLDCAAIWSDVARSSNPGNKVRGHDFVDLLAWSIKEYKGVRSMADPIILSRILVLLADRAPKLGELISFD